MHLFFYLYSTHKHHSGYSGHWYYSSFLLHVLRDLIHKPAQQKMKQRGNKTCGALNNSLRNTTLHWVYYSPGSTTTHLPLLCHLRSPCSYSQHHTKLFLVLRTAKPFHIFCCHLVQPTTGDTGLSFAEQYTTRTANQPSSCYYRYYVPPTQ